MTSEAVEEVLRRLVPLESYRSPAIPTLRFGVPATVTIFAPRRRTDEATNTPASWLAVHAQTGDVLVFAKSSIVTPIAEGQLAPAPLPTMRMHPRDALAVLKSQLAAGSAAFFERRVPPGSSTELCDALLALLPKEFSGWIASCCRDFFDWLEQAAATAR